MSFRSSDDLQPTGTTPPPVDPRTRRQFTVLPGGLQEQDRKSGVRADLTPNVRNTGKAYVNPLSPRERTSLELTADGLTAAEVAGRLGIEEGTVNAHLSRARTKLSARNTVHAVAIALRFGYLL